MQQLHPFFHLTVGYIFDFVIISGFWRILPLAARAEAFSSSAGEAWQHLATPGNIAFLGPEPVPFKASIGHIGNKESCKKIASRQRGQRVQRVSTNKATKLWDEKNVVAGSKCMAK